MEGSQAPSRTSSHIAGSCEKARPAASPSSAPVSAGSPRRSRCSGPASTREYSSRRGRSRRSAPASSSRPTAPACCAGWASCPRWSGSRCARPHSNSAAGTTAGCCPRRRSATPSSGVSRRPTSTSTGPISSRCSATRCRPAAWRWAGAAFRWRSAASASCSASPTAAPRRPISRWAPTASIPACAKPCSGRTRRGSRATSPFAASCRRSAWRISGSGAAAPCGSGRAAIASTTSCRPAAC